MEKNDVTDQRDRQVLRIIIIEGLANVLAVVIKLIVGLSTGSLAVLSDAVHSLTDTFNNVVAWFVTRHSVKPADAQHPYGHRKFETLAVFALASLLVVLAFELIIHAVTQEHNVVTTSPLEIGLMICALCLNIAISIWQRHWAKRLQSDILQADASHTFSDVLVTMSVIIGWQLSAQGFVWVDKLCAIAVGLLILYLAVLLFKRTLPVLLDERAINPELIREAAISVDGVREISRIRSRMMGNTCAVDLIIKVDAQLSTADAHRIADQLEQLLLVQFKIHDSSIHVEPYNP